MGLFKKKEVKTEEQKKQEIKDTEPKVENLNVGTSQPEQEVTLDNIISLNTEAWYKAQVLEQLGQLNANLVALVEEVKKK